MAAKVSVEEVLANLEKRVTYHAEQEEFHARQEVHHREQRQVHAAELAKVKESLEAFRAVSSIAVALAQPLPAQQPDPAPPAPAAAAIRLPPEDRNRVSRLIALAVEALPEPFGPREVAAETSRRFADHLKKPVGKRTASDTLRRLLKRGRVQLVREGTSYHQALYKRKPRRGGS